MNRRFERDPSISEPSQLSAKWISLQNGINVKGKLLTPRGKERRYLEQNIYQNLEILLS